MSPEPDRAKSTSFEEWWSSVDLRAPLETDLVTGAHDEALLRRRDNECVLAPAELRTQRDYFLSRLDGYLEQLSEGGGNGAAPIAGRFLAAFRCYHGPGEQIERRGLVELRSRAGQKLIIIGDRLRPLGGGAAAVEITFNGNTESPAIMNLLSPAAYSSELSKIARLLKTPVGQEFLEPLSPLYCLIREKLAHDLGNGFGWDSQMRSFTPHWSGEETSFTIGLEGGYRASVHLEYVPDLCELAIRPHRLR